MIFSLLLLFSSPFPVFKVGGNQTFTRSTVNMTTIDCSTFLSLSMISITPIRAAAKSLIYQMKQAEKPELLIPDTSISYLCFL
ncbi:hypothetical protein GEMRC1_001103 [Eukaryota sp. GEM-RC1]